MNPFWRTVVAAFRFQGEDWSASLFLALVAGAVVVLINGLNGPAGALTAGLCLSGASLMVGVLLGFLFGIPHAAEAGGTNAQEGHPAPIPAKSGGQYRPNTNLEQVSDWLTKILVGVGLTQLYKARTLLNEAGSYLGPALGGAGTGAAIAVSILLYFSILGFLAAWLWTRIYLAGQLTRADLAQAIEEVTRVQGDRDANALSLVTQYLSGAGSSDTSGLKEAVKQASPPVKVEIYYKARGVRKDPAQKNQIARTIAIFEALAESDPERRFHKNFGQLGYALKDKSPPDDAAAEKAFTSAIESRNSISKGGFERYELGRAVCRIRLDPGYKQGEPSSASVQNSIRADLSVARRICPTFTDPDILKWLDLNP